MSKVGITAISSLIFAFKHVRSLLAAEMSSPTYFKILYFSPFLKIHADLFFHITDLVWQHGTLGALQNIPAFFLNKKKKSGLQQKQYRQHNMIPAQVLLFLFESTLHCCVAQILF